MLSLCTIEIKTLYLVSICSAEDLFTLTSNKFRMVYKVGGKPQLDSRDWSMYFNRNMCVFREVVCQWPPKNIFLLSRLDKMLSI